jgi:arylsulfatase A-like enzyme
MPRTTTAAPQHSTASASGVADGLRCLGPWEILALAAWLGLAAGLIEVATRVCCRAINPTDRLHLMSRHFLWVTPLANLTVMMGLGACLAALTRVWPRLGAWLGPRLLLALAILPALLVVNLQIYPEAWMIMALGMACLLAPALARVWQRSSRWLAWTFPGLVLMTMALAASIGIGDWMKKRSEDARAVPPAGSPNVLLIVLDTVRADRLSAYGYHRPTTPHLERLARNGIRFENARATAPWTLASHASFFTGRWPHELGVQWETPLKSTFPTIAEYLGSHGYVTAGIVANTRYCSADTGLDRGFTHYEDYEFTKLAYLRTAAVVERTRKTAHYLLPLLFRNDPGGLHSAKEWIDTWSGYNARRDAASVNRGLLDWLDRRDQKRPFFAFLNFFDAHAPYRLPAGVAPRFSRRPETPTELSIIYDTWLTIDKTRLPPYYQKLARDSYDNGLAYLDEMLGQLMDDLGRRGLLETTWVVIAGDHGEGLGEHDLYEHGVSLYSTEIRVPLLILPPGTRGPGRTVDAAVSLRDLPATIVELAGNAADAPFPGRSLAPLWASATPSAGDLAGHDVFAELATGNRGNPNQGRSPVCRGPLVSLAEGDKVYIKNEGDGTEELFDERDDPRELTNLAPRPGMERELARFRESLARLKGPAPERAP